MGWNYRDGDSFFNLPDEDGRTFKKFIKNKTISHAEVNGMVNSFASNLAISNALGYENFADSLTLLKKLTPTQSKQLLGEPNLSSNWDDWYKVLEGEPQFTFLFGLTFNVETMENRTTTKTTNFYTVGVYYFHDHADDDLTCVFSVFQGEMVRNYIYEPQPQRYPIQVSKLVKNWLTNHVNDNDFAYDLPKYLPFYFLNYDDGRLSFDGIKIGIKHEDFVKLLGYRGGVKGVSGTKHNRTNPLRYL